MDQEPSTPAQQPLWGRYTELRPVQLDTIRTTTPVVYLPWGALDMHGPHLPLGTDGLIATTMAERLVQRTGGVLMPTTWWPAAVMPETGTVSVRPHLLRGLMGNLLTELAQADWQVVVLLSGYYKQEHELALMEAAEDAIRGDGLLVLTIPPLGLIDQSLLDHAGLWETSLLLALHPHLVDLYALDDQALVSETVVGHDPRGSASASLGDTVFELALERLIIAVQELLTNADPAPLHALYEKRRERYLAAQNRQHDRYTVQKTSTDPAKIASSDADDSQTRQSEHNQHKPSSDESD